MKLCEIPFRKLYKQFILIEGKNILDTLKKVNLCPKGVIGALFFGYVDHQQGMMFELMALEMKENKRINYRIAPVNISFKVSKKDMEEWDVKQVTPNLDLFTEKLEYIQHIYMEDPTLEDLRNFTDLDASRHSDYPDDVIVYLLKEGLDPEAVWTRMDSFKDGKIYGNILVKPLKDIGLKKHDSIAFQITEMEDKKLACVSIIK